MAATDPEDGLRPQELRGVLPSEPERYGENHQGRPLEVWRPAGARARVLVVAGIHGEEPETTVALSSAFRCLWPGDLRCAVVLAANPDGIARGTRANAAGGELNRNFPTADWGTTPIRHCWSRRDSQRVELSPGPHPASEPETAALMALVERLDAAAVVSLHAPLDCVEDRDDTALGRWLGDRSGMRVIGRIDADTPGSFGTWLRENGRSEVVYELPVASREELMHGHVHVLIDLLRGAAPPDRTG
jgi:murein peptide amidase A